MLVISWAWQGLACRRLHTPWRMRHTSLACRNSITSRLLSATHSALSQVHNVTCSCGECLLMLISVVIEEVQWASLTGGRLPSFVKLSVLTSRELAFGGSWVWSSSTVFGWNPHPTKPFLAFVRGESGPYHWRMWDVMIILCKFGFNGSRTG